MNTGVRFPGEIPGLLSSLSGHRVVEVAVMKVICVCFWAGRQEPWKIFYMGMNGAVDLYLLQKKFHFGDRVKLF